MALTLNNFTGFETAGLEEASSTFGSPDATETIIVRNGGRSLKCAGAATGAGYAFGIDDAGISSAGNNHILGFGVYFTDVTPTTTIQFMRTNATDIRLKLEATTGDLLLHDDNDTEVGSAAAPFSVNTWHFVEIYWQSADPGDAEVFVDGISKISVSAQDFIGISAMTSYSLQGGTTSGEDVYFDDVYILSGATSAADRFGDFAVKAYQNTAEDATDQGDTLAAGTWANVSETPSNPANEAQYQDTGNLTGSTIMDEGSRAGPSGDSDVTGATIKGAKYISNLKRGTGSGRTHTILYGNDADGVTATADLGLGTSYAIYEVLSESASIVPTASESFQMGFSKSATAGQDIFCADQWAMLGYVPAAVGVTLPIFDHHYRAMRTA